MDESYLCIGKSVSNIGIVCIPQSRHFKISIKAVKSTLQVY